MDAGTRPTSSPEDAIKQDATSPFFTKCYANADLVKKLSPLYYHPRFNQLQVQIGSGMEITNRPPRSSGQTAWYSGTVGEFLRGILQILQSSSQFAPQMPLKLVLKWAQEIGVLLLGAAPPESGWIYSQCVNDLILFQILDPAAPPSHLTPKGKILRDMLEPVSPPALGFFVKLPLQRLCTDQMTIANTPRMSLGPLDNDLLLHQK